MVTCWVAGRRCWSDARDRAQVAWRGATAIPSRRDERQEQEPDTTVDDGHVAALSAGWDAARRSRIRWPASRWMCAGVSAAPAGPSVGPVRPTRSASAGAVVGAVAVVVGAECSVGGVRSRRTVAASACGVVRAALVEAARRRPAPVQSAAPAGRVVLARRSARSSPSDVDARRLRPRRRDAPLAESTTGTTRVGRVDVREARVLSVRADRADRNPTASGAGITIPMPPRAARSAGRRRATRRSPAGARCGSGARSLCSIERPMLAPSFSTSTCIATIPASITPSSGIQARPRTSRSSSGWSGRPRTTRRARERGAAVGAVPRRRAGRDGAGSPDAPARGAPAAGGRARAAASRERVPRPGSGRRDPPPARPGRAAPRRAQVRGACLVHPRRCRRPSSRRARPAGVIAGGVMSVVTSSLRAARRCADFDLGIRRDLARRRRDRAPGQELGLGLVAADADRELRRAHASARARGEEPLDAAVLERVERDRRQPSAGREQLPGRRQRRVELRQLVVDGDPQRLERPARRMTAGELRRNRDRGLDRVDELLGRASAPRGGESRAIARAICDA